MAKIYQLFKQGEYLGSGTLKELSGQFNVSYNVLYNSSKASILGRPKYSVLEISKYGIIPEWVVNNIKNYGNTLVPDNLINAVGVDRLRVLLAEIGLNTKIRFYDNPLFDGAKYTENKGYVCEVVR